MARIGRPGKNEAAVTRWRKGRYMETKEKLEEDTQKKWMEARTVRGRKIEPNAPKEEGKTRKTKEKLNVEGEMDGEEEGGREGRMGERNYMDSDLSLGERNGKQRKRKKDR